MFSYHNHSSWSDGQASMREMAEAARAAGVEEFGIGDISSWDRGSSTWTRGCGRWESTS